MVEPLENSAKKEAAAKFNPTESKNSAAERKPSEEQAPEASSHVEEVESAPEALHKGRDVIRLNAEGKTETWKVAEVQKNGQVSLRKADRLVLGVPAAEVIYENENYEQIQKDAEQFNEMLDALLKDQYPKAEHQALRAKIKQEIAGIKYDIITAARKSADHSDWPKKLAEFVNRSITEITEQQNLEAVMAREISTEQKIRSLSLKAEKVGEITEPKLEVNEGYPELRLDRKLDLTIIRKNIEDFDFTPEEILVTPKTELAAMVVPAKDREQAITRLEEDIRILNTASQDKTLSRAERLVFYSIIMGKFQEIDQMRTQAVLAEIPPSKRTKEQQEKFKQLAAKREKRLAADEKLLEVNHLMAQIGGQAYDARREAPYKNYLAIYKALMSEGGNMDEAAEYISDIRAKMQDKRTDAYQREGMKAFLADVAVKPRDLSEFTSQAVSREKYIALINTDEGAADKYMRELQDKIDKGRLTGKELAEAKKLLQEPLEGKLPLSKKMKKIVEERNEAKFFASEGTTEYAPTAAEKQIAGSKKKEKPKGTMGKWLKKLFGGK